MDHGRDAAQYDGHLSPLSSVESTAIRASKMNSAPGTLATTEVPSLDARSSLGNDYRCG